MLLIIDISEPLPKHWEPHREPFRNQIGGIVNKSLMIKMSPYVTQIKLKRRLWLFKELKA